MRITCDREALSAALATATKYAARNSTIPVLNHAMIQAGEGEVKIVATDLERAATITIPADVPDPGARCLPLETIAKAAKAGNSSEVSIEVSGGWASVVMGRSRAKMPVLPVDDFPGEMPMLANEAEHSFAVSADWLKQLPRRVGFAVSDNPNRYYLHGIMWRAIDGSLECMATDGHHGSIVELEAPEGAETLPERLVPAVDLPGWTGDVRVEMTEYWARFSCGGITVATKLIDGTFPDFRRAVPKNEISIIMDRDELAKAIDRVSINVDGREHSILFAGENGTLTVSTSTAKGEASDELSFDGDDFRIAVTSRVLRPVLTALDTENVEFRYRDHVTPITIHEPGNDRRVLVAMPYRDPRVAQTFQEAAE